MRILRSVAVASRSIGCQLSSEAEGTIGNPAFNKVSDPVRAPSGRDNGESHQSQLIETSEYERRTMPDTALAPKCRAGT